MKIFGRQKPANLPGEIGMIKLQQGLDDLGWRTFKGCQEHEVKEFQGFHS